MNVPVGSRGVVATRTVAENLAIIFLVGVHWHLQTPMYFFLCNLSFLDMWFTTAFVPKTLATFTSQSGAIPLAGCAAEMYFVSSLGCTEYFLLAAMAYDHYLWLQVRQGHRCGHDACPG
ncbi:Olfactory receptor 287 [Heterocephalus glaber]|uniref:Olfactory receptor 287 n=1 Tax=Heterocephalus glaber TaxID=10181 RepID=G5AVA2_HETGA|nr:Olfactory receptor 287 [Heterocephalus glaber]